MAEYEVHILYRGQILFEVTAKDEDAAIAAGEGEFMHSPLAHEADEWNTIALITLPDGKYTATVSFSGKNIYITESDNVEDAKEKGLALFCEKSNCFPYVNKHEVSSVRVLEKR